MLSQKCKAKQDVFYKELENGVWDNKPSIVLNPLKRHKTKKSLMFFGVAVIFIFIVCGAISDHFNLKLNQAQQKAEADVLKANVQKYADAGKPSAIIWMAHHYPENGTEKLDTLIAQKNTDAMLAKAGMLYKSNKVEAEKYLKMAQEEGDPSAIKYFSNKSVNDIPITTFFSEYLFK